jgi:hypothetical protein
MRLSGAYRVERHSDHRLLFLRLDFANNGAVMVRHLQAAVSLLSVAIEPPNGRVSLQALRRDDPLYALAVDLKPGGRESMAFDAVLPGLGPRERVQTELVFRVPLDPEPLAIRVTATGAQGRWIFRTVPWLGWFAYVHPSHDNADYVSLSITNPG